MALQQSSYRSERINELLKRELILIFANKLADQRLKSMRILDVVISKDLGIAKVFFSSDVDVKKIQLVLKKAQGYLRGQIAKSTQLRHTPELKFIADTAAKTTIKIDSLLANL